MTAAWSAPAARMAARSITLPPERWARERRITNLRTASSSASRPRSSTAGACAASSGADLFARFMAAVLWSLVGYRVLGLVTMTSERHPHVQRDAPAGEAVHQSPQLAQRVRSTSATTALPKRVASAVETGFPESVPARVPA